MSDWPLPEQGLDGADLEKPVLVFQSGIDINAVYQGMQAQQQIRQVQAAVALAWSLAELLGRCFQLDDKAAHTVTWDGSQLFALPEINTPREKIRALMEHILYLASLLNVDAIPIDSTDADGAYSTYAGVLSEQIRKLSSGDFDTGETRQSVLGGINERLYFWDLKIHDTLQNYPAVVYKAYLVGHSLAALRWYFPSVRFALDQEALDKICNRDIPSLGPYLPPFATGALSNSVEVWGKAAIAGQAMMDGVPYSPQQLHTQAQIWHDILTGMRAPLSYVDPSQHGTRYIWRVTRMAWPLFLLHFLFLLVILAVVLVVVIVNFDAVVKAVTAVAGLLALASTAHFALSNINGIVEKALTQTTGAVKGSLIDSLWHSTQQKAVNQATLIAPPPLPQPPVSTPSPAGQAEQSAIKSA